MTTTVMLWRPKGEQKLDSNGVPYVGGSYTYFVASSMTPRTVYKDAAGTVPWGVSVTLDSAGRLTDAVFVDTANFKEIFTPPNTSGDAATTFDGYPGAPAPVSLTTAAPLTPVTVGSSLTITMALDDAGTVVDVSTAAGNVTYTLLPPLSLANGNQITIRKETGDANTVKVVGPIDDVTNFVLSNQFDSVTLVSNGVDSYVVVGFARKGLMSGGITSNYLDPRIVGGLLQVGQIIPLANETVPTGYLECDGSAVSRTTYADLFTAIGTAWGNGDGSTTFNVPDLRGVFLRGWDHGAGIDTDATAISVSGAANNGSGLVRLTVSSSSTFSTGETAFVAGVVGVPGANGTFVLTVIDSTHIDLQSSTFTGSYTSGGTLSGRYPTVAGGNSGNDVGSRQGHALQKHTHSYNAAGSTTSGSGANATGSNAGAAQTTSTGTTGIFTTETRPINAYAMFAIVANLAAAAGASGTLHTIYTTSGAPSSGVGINGDYAIDPTASKLYGPKAAGTWPAGTSLIGLTGPVGPTGSGYDYIWDAGTSAADPGAGKVRANNADLTLVTAFYVNNSDHHTNSQTGWLDALDDSTSTVKGFFQITNPTTGSTHTYSISSVAGSSYRTVTVAHVSGGGTLAAADAVTLSNVRNGDAGSALPAGGTVGQLLTKNSSTAGDASWKTPADSSYLSGRSTSRMLSIHEAFRRAYAFTRATTTATRALKVLTLGDSVGPSMGNMLYADWDRRMGHTINNAAATIPAEVQVAVNGIVIGPLVISAGTATLTSSAYAYGFGGQYYALASGSDVTWGNGGAAFPFSVGKVYYVKEPGAGTLSVSVNGGAATTANASAGSIGLGVMNITSSDVFHTGAGSSIEMTTSGGAVKILYVMCWRTDVNGVAHINMTVGGLSLNDALSTATGQAILGGIIADFAPDVLWFEMKENFDYAVEGDVSGHTFATRISDLSSIINTNIPPTCDAVMVASNAYVIRTTYDSTQQASDLLVNAALKTCCSTNNYLFVDGYNALGADAILQAFVYGAVLPIMIKWRGAYDASFTYTLNDVMTTGAATYRFINATPSSGHSAPNTTYWSPQWAAYAGGTTYSINDIVTSGGYAWGYINATPGSGNAPPTFPTLANAYWQIVNTYSLDGTHPDLAANSYRAALFNSQNGISSSPHSLLPNAVNDVGVPSIFASGSKWSTGLPLQEAKVTARGGGNGVLWDIDFPQEMAFYATLGGSRVQCGVLSGWRPFANLMQYCAYWGPLVLDAAQGNSIIRAATVSNQTNAVEVYHRGNNARNNFGANILNLLPVATSALPTAANAGAGSLAMVTDATATTNGSTLSGSGSNKVIVKSDGTNWIILG